MKRTICRLLGFVVVVVIGTIILFPYNIYSKDIAYAVKKQAAELGIYLSIGDLSLSFPAKCKFTDVRGIIGKSNLRLPFNIEKGSAAVKLTALLQLREEADGDVSAYGGNVSISAGRKLTGGKVQVKAKGSGLELSKDHVLEFLTIGGHIDFELEADIPPPGEDNEQAFGYLEFTLRDGKIDDWKKLETFAAKLLNVPSGFIALTTVQDINIDALGSIDNKTFTLKDFHLRSSLGTAKAKGSTSLNQNDLLNNARLDIAIDLSDEGKKALGPYLGVAANQSSETPSRFWNIIIVKSPGREPRFSVTPRS